MNRSLLAGSTPGQAPASPASACPAPALSAPARALFGCLPEPVRPVQTMRARPRLLEALVDCWNDPQCFDATAQALLQEHRALLAPEIEAEVAGLRTYHARQHRLAAAWIGADVRR